MRLAHVVTTRRGGTDRLLTRFAAECRRAGLRPAGLVQANTARAGTHHCDMDVTVLPDGGTYRISQSLGRGARGCRLDAAALEQAVSEVRQGLAAARPDILVVNKFGRHEAAGGGFRDVIAGALMDDVPVLVGGRRAQPRGLHRLRRRHGRKASAGARGADVVAARGGRSGGRLIGPALRPRAVSAGRAAGPADAL